MKYDCKKCGVETLIPDTPEDIALHERHHWFCPFCYTVIVGNDYDVNIKGALTLFSPVDALGDGIFTHTVVEYYKTQNPDEKVVLLTYGDLFVKSADQRIHEDKPAKFFWCSSTNKYKKPDHKCIIDFSVSREVQVLANLGIYPTLPFPIVDYPSDLKYIAVSARNINKAEFKNTSPSYLNRFFWQCEKWVQEGIIDAVIIIGNDKKNPEVLEPERFVIDLRNKLKLPQIAGVCRNAAVTIGSDNGIIHVANGAGAKIVAWGYEDRSWMPPSENGRVKCFTKTESDINKILEVIDERIRC